MSTTDPVIDLQFLKGSSDKDLTFNWHTETGKFHADHFSDTNVRDNNQNFGCYLWTEDPANENRTHRAIIFAAPARIIAFDFDLKQCNMSKVKKLFKDYHYCLYTTKHHNIDKKGNDAWPRFRLVLCTDRAVNPIEAETIIRYYNSKWNLFCDLQALDGARKFRMGTADSEIEHNFGECFNVDKALLLIPRQFKQTIETGKNIKRSRPQTLNAVKAVPQFIGFIKSRYPDLYKIHGSNSSAVFSLMIAFFHKFGPQKEALKAALRYEPQLDAWYSSPTDSYQWDCIDNTINEAHDCYLQNLENDPLISEVPESTEKENVFVPKALNLDTVDVDALPVTKEVIQIAGLACKLANQNRNQTQKQPSDFYDETRLFLYMVRTYSNAIYGVQCGGGKSVIATAYSTVSGRKSIFIKPTVEDCFTQYRNLVNVLGVRKYGVQVFAGWDSSRCIKSVTDHCNSKALKPHVRTAKWSNWGSLILSACARGWEEFHHPKNTLCHKCGVMEDICPFRATRNPKTMRKKIETCSTSIMTHSRFLEWTHGKNCPDLSKYDIWIDEEPNVYETLELNQNEIDILKKAFSKLNSHSVLSHLGGVESNPKLGTIIDPVFYSREDSKSMQASVSKSYDPLTQTYQPTDPEVKRLCMKYLTFFRGDCDRYAIKTPDNMGCKIMWVRNRLTFDLPANIYLLNASFNHSLVDWEGYKVVEPLKKKIASGIVIECLQSNSTKSKLDIEVQNLVETALETKKSNKLSRTLLCINKDASQSVQDAQAWFENECTRLSLGVSMAHRGSIIGRNDWFDHSHVVVALGLFTTVSHVALLASLIEGGEIEGSRIWNKKTASGKLIQSPRMGKNGFTDPTLREADRRLYCHELYQTIMRGIGRNWQGDKMHVNTLCPSLYHILPITLDLPGVAIVWNGLDVLSIKQEALTKNDIELCKLFGFPNDPNYRKEARKMAFELLNLGRV